MQQKTAFPTDFEEKTAQKTQILKSLQNHNVFKLNLLNGGNAVFLRFIH